MNGQGRTLAELRGEFHDQVCENILGRRAAGHFSNADSGNATSINVAEALAEQIGDEFCDDIPTPQTTGALLEGYTRTFLEGAFAELDGIRPGNWHVITGSSIDHYEQYRHLGELEELLEEIEQSEIKTVLAEDYVIQPDVVMYRRPLQRAELGGFLAAGDGELASLSPLLEGNGPQDSPILHASISLKWSIRTGRSQNTRTEALNLIRNRKGRLPNIVVLSAEPMPTRLRSIASGTGDVDCTYHLALPELVNAVEEEGTPQQREALETLVLGRRLRDISDLPLDLAI